MTAIAGHRGERRAQQAAPASQNGSQMDHDFFASLRSVLDSNLVSLLSDRNGPTLRVISATTNPCRSSW
jgi:hypothetical protein